MKKSILLLFGLILASVFGYSQSQRMVLAEECTSSTCGPCASQNPAFDALLQANADKITSIKYHVWWPSPGTDPMYLDNTVDNQVRTQYYGVNSVPRAILDGTWQGQPAQVTQSLIDAKAAIPSPCEIQVQHVVSPGQDTIFLTTLIKATDDVSGSMIAHNVVIEKHIHFDGAVPGLTNGERDFYNVMKKMLPSNNGTQLPDSMADGDYVIQQNFWVLTGNDIYDYDELAAVVFVQNELNKAVQQAANSSTDAITAVYATDAEMLSVSNVTSANCSGSLTPTVTIRNNGNNNLTSLDIEYSVNGGETQSYEWTGNLAFLETDEIELSEINFEVLEENELTITGLNPNDGTDDYPPNNTFNYSFDEAALISGNANLFLILDDQPEETTWELKNSNGEVVQEGGPYDSPGQKIVPLETNNGDCYEFVIYDAGNNGTEYYAVIYGNNLKAFEGSNFGSHERNEFSYYFVGVDEMTGFTNMKVFPNPATDFLNVSFDLQQNADVLIELFDVTGKKVRVEKAGQTLNGQKNYTMNTSDLNPGLYLLSIQVGEESFARKITIR